MASSATLLRKNGSSNPIVKKRKLSKVGREKEMPQRLPCSFLCTYVVFVLPQFCSSFAAFYVLTNNDKLNTLEAPIFLYSMGMFLISFCSLCCTCTVIQTALSRENVSLSFLSKSSTMAIVVFSCPVMIGGILALVGFGMMMDEMNTYHFKNDVSLEEAFEWLNGGYYLWVLMWISVAQASLVVLACCIPCIAACSPSFAKFVGGDDNLIDVVPFSPHQSVKAKDSTKANPIEGEPASDDDTDLEK